METLKFVYWQDGRWWLGYLEEYPDYQTQAESFDDLKRNLLSLHKDLCNGEIPGVRRMATLVVE